MKNTEIRKLIQAIQAPGVPALLVQVLMQHDQNTGCYDPEGGVIGYSNYVERLLKTMKSQYEKQLKKEPITIQEE